MAEILKTVLPIATPSKKDKRGDNLVFSYPTVSVPEPGQKYYKAPISKYDITQFDHEINQLMKPYNNTDCLFERYGDKNR